MVRLQPKVVLSSNIKHATIAILEEAVLSVHGWLAVLQAEPDQLLAALIASLWLAVKLMGVRDSSPNGVLLHQACRVPLSRLVSTEATILEALQWDLIAVLRSRHVCLE
jgi:hypothetical protein